MRAAVALHRYFLKHLADGELKGSDTVLGPEFFKVVESIGC